MSRGDVYELPSPRGARGREQTGRRFGVVLQSSELMALSTVIVAPTSTRARAASFRPEVTVGGRQTRVLVEQLGAVDQARLGKRRGRLAWSELEQVDEALTVVLGLAW